MILTGLEAEGFRNLDGVDFRPGPGVNIICGDNAQGKTNLMEALWLFTGAKSFRGAKDAELVAFGRERAVLRASFFGGGREQEAEISFSPQKAMKKNGIPVTRPADWFGTMGGVVFSPLQMSLFKDGPKERRRLMDTSLCQLSPKFTRALADYGRVLIQRGSLLRDMYEHPQLSEMLDVFDGQLASLGGYVVRTRVRYAAALAEKAEEVYAGISGGREKFGARYCCSFLPEGETPQRDMSAAGWAELFLTELREHRDRDVRLASTGTGPHRDDLDVTLDGEPVRAYGSQGQQRSCILSIKLAEAAMLRDTLGEAPLVLLDDVMSELDDSRRRYILNSIGESQIFLTCCDAALFSGLRDGRVFRMEDGRLTESGFSTVLKGDVESGAPLSC